MPKVKAVLFDIDNTLFPSGRFAALARRNAVRAMISAGLPFNEEHLYQKLKEIVKRYGSNYQDHFGKLLEALNWERDPKIIAAGIFGYHSTKASLAPYPDVPKTLMKLRDGGYILCAISQGNPIKQWDKLFRLGLAQLLHEVFISEKKTKGAFAAALKRLKVKPKEAVMVGDRLDRDIKPAADAGLRTVRILKGKYSKETADYEADFKISEMHELPKVLEKMGR